MGDRWSAGLIVAMALCCAGPVLIGSGLAAAAWVLVRGHWLWLTPHPGISIHPGSGGVGK